LSSIIFSFLRVHYAQRSHANRQLPMKASGNFSAKIKFSS
jgi:hypothetical protein